MSLLHPNDKVKPEQTKKSTLLRFVKEARWWGKPLHPKLERLIGKYKESQLPGAKPLSWNLCRTYVWGGNLKCNWLIAWGFLWTNRREKSSREPSCWEPSHTFVNLGAQAVFIVNIGEKIPCASGRGRGKRITLKCTTVFCFNKVCPQEKPWF